MFKGDPAKTARARRMKALCAHIRAAGGHTIGLTGTPLLNEPAELYRLCEIFGVQRLAWGSWPAFVDLWGGQQDQWGGMRWASSPPVDAASRFAKVSLRRVQRDVLPELPPITYREIPVSLPRALANRLDVAAGKLEQSLIDWEWHGVMPD